MFQVSFFSGASSLEPAVKLTVRASSYILQHIPYNVHVSRMAVFCRNFTVYSLGVSRYFLGL
jgi:hypothetical protein